MDTRDRILQAAADLWHRNSYDGVGIAGICAAAGVHKGSFFHFFRSKDDLLVEVLQRHGDRLQAGLAASFADDVPPLQRFRRYFDAVTDAFRSELRAGREIRGCPIGNIASELSTRSEPIRAGAARIFDDMKKVFRKALRQAVEAGEVPDDLDVEAAATALLAYLQGMAVLAKTYRDPRKLRGAWEQAFALLGTSGTRV